jgi:hypothetical protein
LQALVRQPGVKAVHSNIRLHSMLAQSLPLIRQPETAAQGGAGTGTTVAVLDTGVDYTRAAFGGCAAPGGSCKVAFARDFAPDDGARDSDGHGTNVAGIVLGVAPGARIAALDVFRNDGFAYSNDLIAAIDWVIANQSTYNIVAMNLSLGGGRHAGPCPADVFATPIANARAAGVLAVIASGNDGYKNAVSSPACAPAAVAVGAVYDAPQGGFNWSTCTDRVTHADQVTCFSNSASVLTLLAPGALIAAAGETMGGTSQATPHVAGALAVLRAAFPGETLDATLARLGNTGRPITDSNGITTPRIDLLAAYTVDRTAYPLTVGKAGTGDGVVRSDPPGIDCGSQCGAEFSAGTPVTLTATPDTSSRFTGWNGACAGTDPCPVTLDAARAVTATFTALDDLSLGEALGNIALDWRTTGIAGWRGVRSSDRNAARSGAIGHDQTSELHAGVTGPGTLSFQWRVSSEAGYDYLEFHLDGVLQFRISGETGWETRTVTIGAGTREIRWIYRKDGSVTAGEDAGWVGAVTLTPTQSGLPNLTVTQVTGPATGAPGGKIEVSAAVVNQGAAAAGAFWMAFLLSRDTDITRDDLDTGWGCAFDGLAGGATATCSGEIGIPAATPPGAYYLGAYADLHQAVLESDPTDNGRAAERPLILSDGASSLVVTRAGAGTGKVSSDPAGIDCGVQCNVNFATGATLTLTATADAGSMFVGWSDDCAGPEAVCTVDMTTAKTVTATFNVVADGGEVFPPNGVWPSGWTIPATTDAGWFVASDWASEGRYSLRSGRIGHDQQSQIEVNGHFQAGVVRFTFYISSEIDYDWLAFSIDGIEQNAWSGEGSRTVSFPLAAGHHTLRWSYEKDGSISSGSDAAWIDEASLPAVASDGDPSTLLITHYYLTILGRAPDADGLAYWRGLIAERQAQGVDVKPVFREMAYFFFNSPEYLGRNTTDAEYLYNLYLTFFQRNPDRGGLEFWLNQLAAGISRNTVMSGFLHSPEFTDFMRDLGF